MGTGVNWEEEWQDKEGQLVGVLGKRIVAEEWSMGEDALVKESRLTRRESTTFVQDFENTISLEPTEIHVFSSSLDSAKCDLEEITKAAWVPVH